MQGIASLLGRAGGALALACSLCAPGPTAAAPDGFVGTAHLVLRRVNQVEGETRSLARQIFEGQVDFCNDQRQAHYKLPPVRPSDAMLARLDEERVEKFYELGVAATHIYNTGLTLPDVRRWSRELAGRTELPPPPDCAAVEATESHSATIWTGGRRYQVNYTQRKVLELPPGLGFTPRTLLSTREFDEAPKELHDGQSCRVVTGPASSFADGTGCLWTAFPPVAWLNFPWALRSVQRMGLPGKLVTTDTLISAERNRAIPPDMLRIPKDFEVRERPR